MFQPIDIVHLYLWFQHLIAKSTSLNSASYLCDYYGAMVALVDSNEKITKINICWQHYTSINAINLFRFKACRPTFRYGLVCTSRCSSTGLLSQQCNYLKLCRQLADLTIIRATSMVFMSGYHNMPSLPRLPNSRHWQQWVAVVYHQRP